MFAASASQGLATPIRRPLRDLDPVSRSDPAFIRKRDPLQQSNSKWASPEPRTLNLTSNDLSCGYLKTNPTMSTPEMLSKRVPRVQSERKSGPNGVTDFSLSALKNSFSMSSLANPASTAAAAACAAPAVSTPDALRMKWERPFFSLTRIRDGGAKKLWRRSWGSSVGSPANSREDVGQATPWQGPECWPALQAHYTYLMDCNLIDSCKSVNGELTWEENGLTSKCNVESSHCDEDDGSSSDEQVTAAPDLQRQLHVVKKWLKTMERRVPDLILRPRWTKETLQKRILEHQGLRRDIESRCAEVALLARRCEASAAAISRVARNLESRYQRLLLRAIEWDYHLESLNNKPPEFFTHRRSAASSGPDSEEELRAKYPRLDEKLIQKQKSQQKDPDSEMVMRKESGSNAEDTFSTTGASPKLTVHGNRRNIAIYDFTHPDTDTEKDAHQQRNGTVKALPEFRIRAKSIQVTSSDEEWVYSNCDSSMRQCSGAGKRNLRAHLDFNSDDHSSGRSWYRYSSSDSDWLQSRDLDLDLEPSESEDVNANVAANNSAQVENSSNLVYDKERVLELANKAERLVYPPAAETKGVKLRKKSKRLPDFDSEADAEGHPDSCDASSELTSGESEAEADAAMDTQHSSKDSALNRTFTVESVNTPVVMRSKIAAKKAERPWSLAGILPHDPVSGTSDLTPPLRPLTASESALNRLLTPTRPFAPNQMLKGSPLTRSVATQKDFSTLSLEKVDSLARRHRGRHRSQRARRADSELLTPTGGSDNACLQRSTHASLASSASLSECSSSSSSKRRHRGTCKAAAVAPASPSSDKSSRKTTPSEAESRVTTAPVDEMSSFSAEQAWDNYQERYLSEAYSEDPPDAESARRLLDFGDDYRNFLDSLSDCPSLTPMPHFVPSPAKPRPYGSSSSAVGSGGSQGTNRPRRNAVKRTRPFEQRSSLYEIGILDSESDVEDLIHVIQTSTSQLHIAQITFTKLINSPKAENSQFAELLATCQTNVECLQTILAQLELAQQDSDMELPSVEELKTVRELISSWELLGGDVINHQGGSSQQREIQQQLLNLRVRLEELGTCIQSSVGAAFSDSAEINPVQALQKLATVEQQLEEQRVALLEANVAVHSFTTNCCAAAAAEEEDTRRSKLINDCELLKSDVAELYKMWDDLQTLLYKSEAAVKEATETWQQLQQQLNELQSTLTSDQQKIQVSLSENPDSIPQHSQWTDCRLLPLCSDSGISSGSDGEFFSLKDREKRLHSLRRLARKLESILSPGSAALKSINDTLDKTERELTALQETCHKIITQIPLMDTSCPPQQQQQPPVVEVRESSAQTEDPSDLKPRRRKPKVSIRNHVELEQALRKVTRFWWHRVAKYSVPFYLGMLVLIFFGYYMEPSCCSFANNYKSSFLPKLHYPYGPPPV